MDYREVFCRDAGYEHVSRYVSGLVLSENKTLEAIHAQQVWPEGKEVSRPAMRAAVFEAGWSSEELMVKHRANVSEDHQDGRGREVIAVDRDVELSLASRGLYGSLFIQSARPPARLLM